MDKGLSKDRAMGKIFYGWKVASVAFLANFMAVGTGFYAINAFLEPICSLRGWSRTSVNIAPMLGTLFGFLCQLLYGTLLDRIGPRLLMSLGSLVAGASFICLGLADRLLSFYLFYVILYIGNGAYAGIVSNTAVNNWFVAERGKALGFATSGMSLSGVVFPFLLMILLVRWDLKTAFLLGGLSVLTIAPLSWRVVRNWPEEMGLLPDGIEATDETRLRMERPKAPANKRDWAFTKALLASPTFWNLGLGYALMMTGAVGVMSQLKPRFVELGLKDMDAMGLMALGALMGAIGKYLWGFLCDKARPDKVVTALAIMNGVGLGLGITWKGIPGLLLFTIIFGISMGGIMSTFPVITAHVYGRENFPHVIRFLYFVLILELVGYIIAGQSYDRTGSYTLAYIIYLFMDIIAAILLKSISLEKGYRS